MTKRKAACEWRWGGAISPGRMICNPANRLRVTFDSPRSAGFSRISTRRSASLAVISLQASSKSGRRLSYFHRCALMTLLGSAVTS